MKPNPAPGDLPPKAARMLADVYESARSRGIDEEIASRQAWTEVKRYYYKKGARWHRRKDPLSRGEYPRGSSPPSGKKRKKAAKNPAIELKKHRGREAYTVEQNGRRIGQIRNDRGRWEARTVALVGGNPRTVVEFHPTKESARDSIASYHQTVTNRRRIEQTVARNQPLRQALDNPVLEALHKKLKR